MTEWRDVGQNPEGAAVGRDNEIVVLDHQIVNRRARKIELQTLPVLAVVERDEDASFGSREEKPALGGVFPHGMDDSARGQGPVKARPGLATVRRLENIGSDVVELVPVDGDVSCPRIET